MKCRHWMPPVLVITVALAAAARAEDAGLDPARNEVFVFGGLSIFDARSSQQTAVTVPSVPGFRGRPATDAGDVQVRTETKMGNSGLVGFRYAFYLRRKLALEADAAVAPGHDLWTSGDLCASSSCYGGDDRPGGESMHAREGHGDGRYGFSGRSVTAWHYGGGLTYDILGGNVRPFLIAGAGGVTYDGTPQTRTDFVLRFGAGLKVYFGRLGARVDAIDHLVFDNFLTGHDEHDVHLTGGAFVRF